MHLLRIPLPILLLLAWVFFPVAAQAEETIRIGVLAKRGDAHTVTRWQPTADYLSREIPGYRFTVVPLDFVEIGQAVAEESVEFVLVNPAIYVDFETRYGIGHIATMRNRNGHLGYTLFGGVIFTRADRGDINTIPDLKGKRFAAVKENSFGGYLMARREMKHQGVIPARDTKLQFAGTHDAVVIDVLQGKADAGTVRTDTLERMRIEGKIDLAALKVLNPQQHPGFHYLCSTPLYPEWPFAKVANTPDELAHEVAVALLRLTPDSRASMAGEVAGWTVPRNYQAVDELLRELRIGPYAQLGKITFEDLLRNYWHWVLLVIAVVLLLSIVTGYVTQLNLNLREAEEKLIEARDHLAEKVRERTAELEESYRRLERASRDWNDAFDAVSDPIFIHDREMRIVQANPAYCARAGHPLEEMRGKPYYEFFPKQDGPLHSCEIFPERLQAEGDELQLVSGEVFVSRSFGIRRADNTILYAIHILEDVTEVRHAESRRRILSRAVEQAGEGVLILDRDMHMLYCNPGMSRLLGRDRDGAYCITGIAGVEELVPPHFAAQLLQLFSSGDDGEKASAELELLRVDGSTRPVFITVGGIREEEGGDNTGYVMTALDLAEVKRAEKALTYRIGFESVISRIASRLVNIQPVEIDEATNDALQMLGEFARTDRAYLFTYDADNDTISNTHEWCAAGASPQRDRLQHLPFTSLPWLRGKMLAAEAVSVSNVDDLPAGAVAEREEFQREDIRALLLVPLAYGNRFSGFVGFDNIREKREWAVEDTNLLRIAGEIIINSQARIRAMQSLQHSEASLAAAQHIAHIGNWEWNIASGELEWSDEIYRIFGLEPHQFGATYDAFLEAVHPDDRSLVMDEVDKAVTKEKAYAIDHRIVRPDGTIRMVHEMGEVHFEEGGEPALMIGTVQDVTEQRQAEREMQRLNRALRTLSLCNTTMVHAENEQELMDDICRILIDQGGYRFVWVGYAEHDQAKTIRPVAHAGSGHEFLYEMKISWADDETGDNPAGYAVRNAETFVSRDIAAVEGDFEAWRKVALGRGYAAVSSLPLISQGEVLGMICIHSLEASAFDPAELQLLEEMAGDLAFGITTMRNRVERDVAEQALQKTEERYEELYENAPNAYVSVSAADGRIVQFNQALCDILGYPRETLQEMKVFELYADTEAGLPRAKQLFAEFKKGGGRRDQELQMRHADGHLVWVSVSIDPVLNERGEVIESRSMVIDISERKKAEVERGQFAQQLQRSLLQTIQAVALTIEKRDPYTAGHQERVAELVVRIGREMGLSNQEVEGLKLGALIHDIGKISVPAEILNRPGALEPEMYFIIQTHPQSGFEIIRGIDFPWPLAQMVRQHHERLDGSGYPDGLKGEEILLESRILAVADVVEAMASHRPYRASLGLDAAMAEIEKGKGTLYDAQVVDACLKVLREQEGMAEWIKATLLH